MKKLFNDEEFEKARYNDLLFLKCYVCEKPFQIQKRRIIRTDQGMRPCKFCSQECRGKAQCKYTDIYKKVKCLQCNCEFEKKSSQIVKTNNNFCSRSCAATYNNTHKTIGTRRSKLELWIEEKLKNDYPNLSIKFNDKEQIGSELDVYIEDFKLAFELNGIFHYEPIYGEDKLKKIKNNDNRKFQACLENKIELCIIDTSNSKNFKPQRDVKYYEIIRKIIENKMVL